jgi:predicted HAD superfamily phosphohydrolase
LQASICSLFTPHWKDGARENLASALHEVFGEQHPAEVQEILDKYGLLSSGTTSDPEEEEEEEEEEEASFARVLDFINDVVALAPVVHFAQSWPGPVLAYYFNEGNPWDGPYKA